MSLPYLFKENMGSKYKRRIPIAISIVLIIVLIILAFIIDRQSKSSEFNDIFDGVTNIVLDGEKYSRGNISTYLFMGVDNELRIIDHDPEHEQTDFLMLMVVNHTKKDYTFLHINRDTITSVGILGYTSQPIRYETKQISLAHTYGKEEDDRCLNVCRSVELLLHGLKIDYYVSFTMPAVELLVNELLPQGVSVTIDDETAEGSTYTPGQVLNLDGAGALEFVRDRQSSVTGNIERMARQRLLLNSIKDQMDLNTLSLTSLVDNVGDYIYSSLYSSDYKKLEGYFKNETYKGNGFVCPNGTVTQNQTTQFAEFTVNDGDLRSFLKKYCLEKNED